MLQLCTVLTHTADRPWHSLSPYTSNANDYYLSLDLNGSHEPIGRIWRDFEDLPWNYGATGSIDGRNGFYSWTLPKVLAALWQWRCDDWASDRLWRQESRLPPDPRLGQLLALEFDFEALAVAGRARTIECRQLNLLAC
jgi:hypothetical protein